MSEITTESKHTHAHTEIFLKDYKAPTYFIDDVHLEFDLAKEHTIVKSTLHVRFNRHHPNPDKQLKLNGEELTLLSVKLDGKVLDANQYQQTTEFLILSHLPESCDIEITVRIHPDKNTALSGLYKSGNTYCTQCEPEGFRRITYFADHPDILSRYTTTIVADAALFPVLLSNGNLINSGAIEGGRHFATWEDPFKKPSYLFALVAGSFDLLEGHFVTMSGRDVLLRIYTDKGFGDAADHALFSLQAAMRWDEVTYGREYDLDIYMIVAIGDFNMGAMENKGLNIFNTKYILAKPDTATDDDYMHILSVIGHEYFHNWSGNRVTCRDWFQLSLKEGLTIFRDQSFSEDTFSKAVMRIADVNRLREVQFAEDAGPLSHPVRPDSYIEINNFYTATIYQKGAEVLRMLQTILGNTLFRKGMDLYFATFDGQAVTIDDFVDVMQGISGIDLKQFKLWYSQSGTPVVDIDATYDQNKKTYAVNMTQKTAPTRDQAKKQALYIPIRMGLIDSQGKSMPLTLAGENKGEECVLFLHDAKQQFVFENVAEKPIPSWFRHFSAPVKFNFPYSDEELIYLCKHDHDAFNRWEAGQAYMLRVVLRLVADTAANKPLKLPQELIDCFKYLLTTENHDYLLLSEMLLFPSEKYISEQMQTIDVDGIHAAREFILQGLAESLENEWINVYKKHHTALLNKKFAIEHIGMRQLKNRCLSFLMLLPQHLNLGIKQFEQSLAVNMTDTQAALMALTNIDAMQRSEALNKFYQHFVKDPLVMDKWLSIQAISKLPNTLKEVKALYQHSAFDIKNPNKVYALIGTFGHRNHIHFHAKNGEGYVFLREVVSVLNKLNPQIAARMANPLTSFKRYDKERQGLMRAQLELLLKDTKLSPDLYELITKSLE